MDKKAYLDQRAVLLKDSETLIAEGKIEEADAKMKEIEELDAKWEEIKLANANMNALKEKAEVINLENRSVDVKGVKTVDNIVDEKPLDEKAAYEIAWAKVMQGKKLEAKEQEIFDKVNVEFRNAYTHDTGDIATLIPETVVAGIWKRAEEMYPLLADVKKYNIRGTLVINKHESIAAGDAAWYDEDTETADEKNVFGQLILSGCELAKAITITWKLRAMATEDFIPYIKNELGERVGAALGTAIAQGKGKPGEGDTFKPEPLGIETALLAESSAPQVVTYNPDADTPDPLRYEKITAAIAKIHSSYLSGCAIYANNTTIWNELATLTDEVGRPLFIPDVTSGGVGKMFGMTVKADAGVTTNNIIIGNAAKGYVMNINEPMSIATEEHVKARTVDYAVYAIVDGAPLDTKAFALIQKVVAAG
ncbi:MAG: phage major capsid protein [Candidatus Syntrophopropionicum ammoniitolerans]